MKVKVIGNMMHVFMDFSNRDLSIVREFDPDALFLVKEKNDSKEIVFAVENSPSKKGSLSQYGASFAESYVINEGDENGNGYKTGTLLNIQLPAAMTNTETKEYVASMYGVALSYLKEVEVQIKEALQKRDEFIASVSNEIDIESFPVE